MLESSRYFFLAGALPFVLLGLAHGLATPLALGDRKGLSPRDPDLAGVMARSFPRLTSRTDMWRAWVGFNLSHSLGALAFGAFVLIVGRSAGSYGEQAGLVVPFASCVSMAYLGLAARYWFRIPILGCALSLGSFLASWALLALGGP